jgi:hypothetical protein
VATPVSLILIAVGLVLALAVHPQDTSSVDVNMVGWIIFAVGAVGMLLTLLFWDSWAGPGYWRRRHAYTAGGYPPAGAAPPARRTVIEEEVGPPPVDPPPPPPPPY